MAKIGETKQIRTPNLEYSVAEAATDLLGIFASVYAQGETAKTNQKASEAANRRHVQAQIIGDLSDTQNVLDTNALKEQIDVLRGMSRTGDESLRELSRTIANTLTNNVLPRFEKRDEISLGYQQTNDALRKIRRSSLKGEASSREELESAQTMIDDIDSAYFENIKYMDNQTRSDYRASLAAWQKESSVIDFLLMGDDPETTETLEQAVPDGWDNVPTANANWNNAWMHYKTGNVDEALNSIEALARSNVGFWEDDLKEKQLEKSKLAKTMSSKVMGQIRAQNALRTEGDDDAYNNDFNPSIRQLISLTQPDFIPEEDKGITEPLVLKDRMNAVSDFIRGGLKEELHTSHSTPTDAWNNVWKLMDYDKIHSSTSGEAIDKNIGDTRNKRNYKYTAFLAYVSQKEVSFGDFDDMGSKRAGRYFTNYFPIFFDQYESLYGEGAMKEFDDLYETIKQPSWHPPKGLTKEEWLLDQLKIKSMGRSSAKKAQQTKKEERASNVQKALSKRRITR